LGLINGKWACRLLKGNTLKDSYVFKDEDLSASGFPNQNLIVGWVLRTVANPNINPHQIMKTIQALAKQAITKREEKKDGGDRFPYPYIFTHPRPPDDFAAAAQVQVRAPLKDKDPEGEVNCQYCGVKLTKEEQFTHSCKKKPEVNNI